MARPGFGELVGLMVWGSGAPDSCRGLIRSVEDGTERRERVTRAGCLAREETGDGQVRRINGRNADWFWDVDAQVMTVRPHVNRPHRGSPIGGLSVGGLRPSWSRWEGTDFTRPCSPVERVEFLGRPCYTVELAPPSHKPFPLRITVDAATGLMMRKSNAGFGTVSEWVDVSIGADVADDAFVWTGPAEPIPTRDFTREHEAEVARHREWLHDRGVGAISIPAKTEVILHDRDDETGSFYASVEARQDGALIRRPLSDRPWDEPGTTNYEHEYRWSDERWDWFLATDVALEGDELDALKARLRAAT